jgi:hypothetical protein
LQWISFIAALKEMELMSKKSDTLDVYKFTARIGIHVTVCHLILFVIYIIFFDDLGELMKTGGPVTAVYVTSIAVWFTNNARRSRTTEAGAEAATQAAGFRPEFVQYASIVIYSVLAVLVVFPIYVKWWGMGDVPTMLKYHAYLEAALGTAFGVIMNFLFGAAESSQGHEAPLPTPATSEPLPPPPGGTP